MSCLCSDAPARWKILGLETSLSHPITAFAQDNAEQRGTEPSTVFAQGEQGCGRGSPAEGGALALRDSTAPCIGRENDVVDAVRGSQQAGPSVIVDSCATTCGTAACMVTPKPAVEAAPASLELSVGKIDSVVHSREAPSPPSAAVDFALAPAAAGVLSMSPKSLPDSPTPTRSSAVSVTGQSVVVVPTEPHRLSENSAAVPSERTPVDRDGQLHNRGIVRRRGDPPSLPSPIVMLDFGSDYPEMGAARDLRRTRHWRPKPASSSLGEVRRGSAGRAPGAPTRALRADRLRVEYTAACWLCSSARLTNCGSLVKRYTCAAVHPA